MSPQPRQPLRIETQHDDHVVVLGCGTCDLEETLRTGSTSFAADVSIFFERHADCEQTIDLTGPT
jgi:hypothetical protein